MGPAAFAAYFYADNRLLTSTRATRLQREFETLKELFDGVGLQTNMEKTIRMAWHPCHALGGHSAEA